jgi:hypothetical protein
MDKWNFCVESSKLKFCLLAFLLLLIIYGNTALAEAPDTFDLELQGKYPVKVRQMQLVYLPEIHLDYQVILIAFDFDS